MRGRRAVVAVAVVIGAGVLRSRLLTWGAGTREREAWLPGDELIPDPDLTATRGITVRAPARDIWPWIAQMGQGRGGFYSYDFLENLVGCDIHSADRVVAGWQEIRPGDEVRLTPDGGLTVSAVQRGRSLVLRGVPATDGAPLPFDFTWSFVLSEGPGGTTRLLARERYGYTRGWARLLVEPIEVASFVMSLKMLRGIRDRAEGAASSRG